MSKPRATLSPAAAMRREDRLQQREDRLTYKVSDLRAQIASLTAENERFRDLLEHIQGRILFPFNQAAEATRDEDFLRRINAALNPKPEETA